MRPWGSLLLLLSALAALGCGTNVTFPPGGGMLPDPTVPPYTHQARFAITDNRSDTLSFVTADQTMPQLLGTAVVGDNPVELEGPHHLAASPDGKYIYYNLSNYVPGTGSGPHGSHGTGNVPGSLVKLDARTMENVGEAIVDKSPGDVILSTDGKLAYVTHYDLLKYTAAISTPGGTEEMAYSTLAIVDTVSMARKSLIPLCVTAHGEGLSADGKTLYATCAQTDQVAVVDVSDPAHPKVTARVPVGPAAAKFGAPPAYSPYALTVSPTDGTAWVCNNSSGDVRVFDPATMQMDPSKTVFVGGVAMFGIFTKDGKTFFVPHQGDDAITAIDTATLATTARPVPHEACLNAHMLQWNPDQTGMVLVCEGDHVLQAGTAVWLTPNPLVVTGYVTIGLFPDGAAWLPPLP
jgi:DNA-binding beta-propeller fold protein YncE